MLHYGRAMIIHNVRSRMQSERGATAVEYGLLVVLIAAVIVAVVATLGQKIKTGFTTTDTCLANPAAC